MTVQSHHSQFSLRNRAALLATVAALFIVSASTNNSVGFAQSTAREDRRVLRMKSRTDAAVAITSVRKLQVDNWLEQLEIEVKNVSHKPVYYLEISITLPGVVSAEFDGAPINWGLDLTYGRQELMKEAPTSDDIPIQAGESHVFKIPQKYGQELQSRLASGPVPASAVRKVFIRVEEIGFGDGTGFIVGGVPFP